MTNREYLEKVEGVMNFRQLFDDIHYADSWILRDYCLRRSVCPIVDLHELLEDPCYNCFNEWLDKEHK